MAAQDDKFNAMHSVYQTLAADTASSVGSLTAHENEITAWQERDGRRRYPVQSRPLIVVTTGFGVVASAHADHHAWLYEHVRLKERDEIFTALSIANLSTYLDGCGQMLLGPDLKYVCSSSRLRRVKLRTGIEIVTYEGDALRELYRYPSFTNALGYGTSPERPDVLATIAMRNGEIVGIAGASDECDTLWQIGVDVIDVARGSGVGSALVSRLTEEILDRGRIPYYATSVSNIASRSLAVGLGFWPAWTEMYARDRKDEGVRMYGN